MKKNNWILGVIFIILAMGAFYGATVSADHRMDGILYGLMGALGGNGVLMIVRYFYWKHPGNEEKYQEMAERKAIEQHDELKQKIRDKAGRWAYLIGMLIVCISVFVYTILGALGIMDTKNLVVYLGFYLISQVLVGIVAFNYFLKKYE